MTLVIPQRRYYSARNSSSPDELQLTLHAAKSLFESGFNHLRGQGYWNQALGWWCVDEHDIPGTVGSDVGNYVLLKTRKCLWPIEAHLENYDEADLFDMIEFLHDHVSKPTDGRLHSYGGCGMHWEKFDQMAGQADYRLRSTRCLRAMAQDMNSMSAERSSLSRLRA